MASVCDESNAVQCMNLASGTSKACCPRLTSCQRDFKASEDLVRCNILYSDLHRYSSILSSTTQSSAASQSKFTLLHTSSTVTSTTPDPSFTNKSSTTTYISTSSQPTPNSSTIISISTALPSETQTAESNTQTAVLTTPTKVVVIILPILLLLIAPPAFFAWKKQKSKKQLQKSDSDSEHDSALSSVDTEKISRYPHAKDGNNSISDKEAVYSRNTFYSHNYECGHGNTVHNLLHTHIPQERNELSADSAAIELPADTKPGELEHKNFI